MHRTVLIGLDGATFTILDPFMADGVMPFLKDFLSHGVRAELLSTPNPITPAAWTSLVTGRTPGNHGIFDFIHGEEGPKGFYFTLNMSYDVRCETIWSIVSRQGGTVTSLNFPVSSPPEPANGYCVPGFVHWRHLRRSVHPAEFYEALTSIPGFDPKELSMDVNQELKSIQYLPRHEYEGWISRHISREWQWFGIMRHILKNSPTDLMAVVFDGVDKLQHLCWQYLDPALFPVHPTPWEARIRHMCLDYFHQLDGFIRDIVTFAGPEARVFLGSDHGFGATREVFYANVWLEQEGYLSWSDQLSKDELGKIAADRVKSHVVGIDWTETTAYALTPSSNGIFIRRADGPGQPGVTDDEYEPFRRQLAAKLLAFRHPATGRPFLKRVLTREEAFPGNAAQRAPDLTLVLEDYGFLSVLNADETIKPRPEPVGTHRPQGVFMAGGAGIAGPRSLHALSIVDMAPTLLHSLGLPIPVDIEGRVATECYHADFLNTLPVTSDGSTRPPDGTVGLEDASRLPDAEQERVINRLRELGYIE